MCHLIPNNNSSNNSAVGEDADGRVNKIDSIDTTEHKIE